MTKHTAQPKIYINDAPPAECRKKLGPMIACGFEYFGSENRDNEFLIIPDDPAPFKIIAKFQGDWLDDLDTAISVAVQEEYTPREYHPDYLYTADLKNFPGRMPKLEKMCKMLGFTTTPSMNIQMQRPGCLIPKHTDPEAVFKNKNGSEPHTRVIITLSPGEYGQILGYNTSIVTRWETGTVIYADYSKVWHFTANCSWHTRPILLVTGQVNSDFKKLLSNNEPTIFQL
jgi:hypothetical protein